MYAITVTFVVKPENADDFHAAILTQAQNSLTREPDCHRFDVARDPDDPARFFLYELYTDSAAFDAHLASPHFAEFIGKVEPWEVSRDLKGWDVVYETKAA